MIGVGSFISHIDFTPLPLIDHVMVPVAAVEALVNNTLLRQGEEVVVVHKLPPEVAVGVGPEEPRSIQTIRVIPHLGLDKRKKRRFFCGGSLSSYRQPSYKRI